MAARYKPGGPKLARPSSGVGASGPKQPLGNVSIAKPITRPQPGATGAQRRAVNPAVSRNALQQQQQQRAELAQQAGQIKVGDRVLVGGVKPGVVAYLGPTEFAPRGTWAGVILDSYDGKNNGTVQGVAYFVCEANRGLFSRPENLTVLPRGGEVPPATSMPQRRPPPAVAAGIPPSDLSVGSRILVDGVKPGVVAFLGMTEFAKGEWAGVVLDAPEGKNNGTVAGVSYFTCEPNHGLFSRPQRLTLDPKAAAQQPARQEPRGSKPSPAPSSSSSAPATQDQEMHHPPSMPRSAQSTPVNPEQLKALREKLKLGDRVLVGGQKEGFLRFIGTTEFAKGVWVGVELEEPLGKNDGAVSGKR